MQDGITQAADNLALTCYMFDCALGIWQTHSPLGYMAVVYLLYVSMITAKWCGP